MTRRQYDLTWFVGAIAVAVVTFYACAPPPLPAEGPITVTVHCASRDGG